MTGLQEARPPVGADPPQAALVPSQLPELFMRFYNAGDIERVNELFEPAAVQVTAPGVTVSGAERAAAMLEFYQQYELPIIITLRQVYDCGGGLALIIGDHVMDGVSPDGTQVHMAGTSADVARRGEDGYWRYVIDNPGVLIDPS